MHTHYRRLTTTELEDLRAELATDVDGEQVKPSVYDALASFGGVEVGHTGCGELPSDFPGYTELTAAEITTYQGVRAVDDLTTIDGIGPATEEKILDALPPRDLVVQVLGGADAELPGSHLADTVDELPADAAGGVLRARIEVEETDPETGEAITVTKQVPEAEIPFGATVLETGINPHQFAGA